MITRNLNVTPVYPLVEACSMSACSTQPANTPHSQRTQDTFAVTMKFQFVLLACVAATVGADTAVFAH